MKITVKGDAVNWLNAQTCTVKTHIMQMIREKRRMQVTA